MKLLLGGLLALPLVVALANGPAQAAGHKADQDSKVAARHAAEMFAKHLGQCEAQGLMQKRLQNLYAASTDERWSGVINDDEMDQIGHSPYGDPVTRAARQTHALLRAVEDAKTALTGPMIRVEADARRQIAAGLLKTLEFNADTRTGSRGFVVALTAQIEACTRWLNGDPHGEEAPS